MIKNIFLPALSCLLFASAFTSCNSNNKPENSSDRVDSSATMNATDTTLLPTTTIAAKQTDCYQFTQKRDTVSLTLHQDGAAVTGDLNYRFYEKDKSKGTLSGEMKGDTILGEYTFDSEGMRSVREIVFLKKDGKLYEGYGDVEEKGGKVTFKNRSALKFGEGVVLSKTDCK